MLYLFLYNKEQIFSELNDVRKQEEKTGFENCSEIYLIFFPVIFYNYFLHFIANLGPEYT